LGHLLQVQQRISAFTAPLLALELDEVGSRLFKLWILLQLLLPLLVLLDGALDFGLHFGTLVDGVGVDDVYDLAFVAFYFVFDFVLFAFELEFLEGLSTPLLLVGQFLVALHFLDAVHVLDGAEVVHHALRVVGD